MDWGTDFEGLNIVIIGDLIIDHYLMGEVHRISPEAPVPVVLHQEESFRLGGAANVALNLKAMGATPYLIGTVGNDTFGEQLLNELIAENIATDYIVVGEQLQTTCKTRVMARHQQLLRYDREKYHELSKGQQQQIIKNLKKIVKNDSIDAIIFQDYNKGVLVKEIITDGIKIAINNKIPTLVDPKQNNFWQYQKTTLFKPNWKEVTEALKMPPTVITADTLHAVAQQLAKKIAAETILITLGAEGMYLYQPNQSKWIPTQKRAIADVCGAGDTVVSVVALGLAAGRSMEQIVKLANIAGGQVCEQVGVVPVNKIQLFDEYQQRLTNG